MDTLRSCGCKGCRTCLICESEYNIKPKTFELFSNKSKSYFFCIPCKKAYKGWTSECIQSHPKHETDGISIPGVLILENFINEVEEEYLVNNIDNIPWDTSQSGRRKKNFGPKTNFKKRKIVNGNFNGFPQFSKFIQERFVEVALLKDYETIEQCFMEYDSCRGASIDPHIDDCWIWGERILTVNCLSDSVLTLNRYEGDAKRYNLEDAKSYRPIVKNDGTVDFDFSENVTAFDYSSPVVDDVILRLPMPRRSLMVLYGELRYHWEHCVLREDITSRRVIVAYREFTPPYLHQGVKSNIVEEVRQNATKFWDTTP